MFGGAGKSVNGSLVRRNPGSWRFSCPGNYKPVRVGVSGYVCYSQDFTEDKQHALQFAGFLKCQAPDLEDECTLGYSKRHLLSLAADCELYYCARVDLKEPWIIKEENWPKQEITPLPYTDWSHMKYDENKEAELRVDRDGVAVISMPREEAYRAAAEEEKRGSGTWGVETRGALVVPALVIHSEALLQAFIVKRVKQIDEFSRKSPCKWQHAVKLARSGATDKEVGQYLETAIEEVRKKKEGSCSDG